MALEPLGSVTVVQAQSAPELNKATQAENKEVVRQDQPSVVDTTTVTVAKSENKADSNHDSNDAPAEQQKANNEKIRKAVEQLNKNMPHSEAVYGFHEDTNRVTIKIVDKNTKEVIKELPPEKTLDMIAKVWEMAGILVDEKR